MSTHYNPKIVTDGIMLALDAANPKSYPGSGTTWYDLSGKGNNGTLVNGPTISNQLAVFDGINDCVNLPDITDIRLSDVSFEFIFKLDNISSDQDLLCKGNHDLYQPAIIWFDAVVGGGDLGTGNVNCISVLSYDGSTQHWISTNSNTIEANKYYHLVVVLEPSNNKKYIYLNGILSQSNTKTWNGIRDINNNIRLCSAGTSTAKLLDGNMNLFKTYNRALTANEVAQNFNATRGRYGI